MPSANDIAAAVVSQQSKAITDAQQQTPEMVEAQTNYVAALQNLTEMLGKVNDQSQRLTRDSEEMENLNRTRHMVSLRFMRCNLRVPASRLVQSTRLMIRPVRWHTDRATQ